MASRPIHYGLIYRGRRRCRCCSVWTFFRQTHRRIRVRQFSSTHSSNFQYVRIRQSRSQHFHIACDATLWGLYASMACHRRYVARLHSFILYYVVLYV